MSSWRRAFERVEPGQTPGEAPKELQIWSKQSVLGLLGGMLFGGYRGLLISRTDEPSPLPANSRLHRASMFFVRESIFTGARIGLFVSTFSALVLSAHHVRGVEHPTNVAVAGGITCGLFGGAIGGWFGALRSSAFGTIISGAAAYVQEALKQISKDVPDQDVSKLDDSEIRVKETINNLITRYESNLESRSKEIFADNTSETVSARFKRNEE